MGTFVNAAKRAAGSAGGEIGSIIFVIFFAAVFISIGMNIMPSEKESNKHVQRTMAYIFIVFGCLIIFGLLLKYGAGYGIGYAAINKLLNN